MPSAAVNGVKINYMQVAQKGGGPARDLVMIHGLAANMGFWLDGYAAHFADSFRVTLYDLRGHGRSQVTDSGYRPEDMQADLSALLDSCGIEKAHLAAHSFGGIAALRLACATPDRVESLILMDTHIGLGRKAAEQERWDIGEALQKILDSCSIALDVRDPYFGFRIMAEMARYQRDEKDIPPALLPYVQHIIGDGKALARWLTLTEETKAMAELTGDDGLSEESLRRIPCPALLLYGEKSQSMASGRLLGKALPQADFITVPDAGHFFPKTRTDFVQEQCAGFYRPFLKNGLLTKKEA